MHRQNSLISSDFPYLGKKIKNHFSYFARRRNIPLLQTTAKCFGYIPCQLESRQPSHRCHLLSRKPSRCCRFTSPFSTDKGEFSHLEKIIIFLLLAPSSWTQRLVLHVPLRPKAATLSSDTTLSRPHPSTSDPGGYWWPPTYSTWTPTIVSFSFSVSLIVAQFTIFGSFRVLNFWSHFEALNDIFSASNGRENMSVFWTQWFLFMVVFLEYIFLTMYHVC